MKPITIPLLLLLLLPFTASPFLAGGTMIIPIFCNARDFSGKALPATKSGLLSKLKSDTYSNPNHRCCTTSRSSGGGGGRRDQTLYGYAYCAAEMVCGEDGSKCPTSYEECSACLSIAGECLAGTCKRSIGGHVTVKTEKLVCYMRYETRKFC